LFECGGNLEKFYERCGQLAQKDPAERNRILEQYANRSAEQAFQEVK
jgi:hypothetical protein